MAAEIKAGDRVEIGWLRGVPSDEYLPQAIETVTKVGKYSFTTSSGRKWSGISGSPYGGKWSSLKARLFGPEDEKAWGLAREKNFLKSRIPQNFDLCRCDLETLRVVVPILFPEAKEEVPNA